MSNLKVPRFHLISNSKSGRGAGGSLKELAQRVALELGFELVHHEITDPLKLGEIAETAVKTVLQEGSLLAAAGGDGTVRSVAQRIVGKKIRFAVIPCGTFNLFARAHGIPLEAEAALRLAMTGSMESVRVGQVNDEVFILNASLGLYAKAIQERKARTRRWGRHRIVALLSTFWSLLGDYPLLDVELITTGLPVRTRTPMIFIGNNSLQLKNLSLKIAQCMEQDLLAVVTMKAVTRWQMVRVLLRGISRTLQKEESLDSFCVDTLTIRTHRKSHSVALDGEMFTLSSPLVIHSLPEALSLIKPTHN
jgi:diacylglycerol kinase family enzyme